MRRMPPRICNRMRWIYRCAVRLSLTRTHDELRRMLYRTEVPLRRLTEDIRTTAHAPKPDPMTDA